MREAVRRAIGYLARLARSIAFGKNCAHARMEATVDDDEIRDLIREMVWLDVLRALVVVGIVVCVLLLAASCEFRVGIDSRPTGEQR